MKALPYEVLIESRPDRPVYPLKQWCMEHLGPRWSPLPDGPYDSAGNWTVFWTGAGSPVSYRWHFRYEKDAMWFKLRWE